MTVNKQEVPKIRFMGFSGDWENNRLSSVFSIFSGNAFSSKDQAEEGIIWLKIADVGIQKMTPNNLSYLPFGYKNKYEKYLIKKDDVVIALTRPILDKRLKMAVAGKRYDGALLNQRVGKILSANNHIPFIYCLLQQEKLISQFESSIAGTDPPNLSLNEIKDISLTIPTKKEQIGIGNFFQQLDKLIELQSRAVESAETYKKAMLQKMFPQKGEKVPRVRFEGFSGDWDFDILNNVMTTINLKNYLVSSEENGEFPVIQQGDTAIAGYSNQEPYHSYENIVLFGDHTLSLYKPQEAFLISTDGIKALTAPAFDSHYFYFLLENYKPISEGYKRHFTILRSIVIAYPSLKEQTKIGNFFQKLDQNIEAEKKKLEKYQDMKKAMLQRMFV